MSDNTILPYKPYNWNRYNNQIKENHNENENDFINRVEKGFDRVEDDINTFDNRVIRGAKKFGDRIETGFHKSMKNIKDELKHIF